MPKAKSVLPIVIATLLTLAIATFAFAAERRAGSDPTPDPRWPALATAQRLAFDSTRDAPRVSATAPPASASPIVPPAPVAAATDAPAPTPTLTGTPTAPVPTPTAAPATATPVAPTPTAPAATPIPTSEAEPSAAPTSEAEPSATPPLPLPTATVAVAALNVRARPGLAFSVIATLERGDAVALTGARSGADGYLWVEVVLADGRRGWTLGEPVGVR